MIYQHHIKIMIKSMDCKTMETLTLPRPPVHTSKGGTCSAAQTSSAAPALTEARKVVSA